MPISFFVDKTHCPENEELALTLGTALPVWTRITDFIAKNYAMVGDMMYGGKNYGWNLWYRKSGKSLVSLYPQENHIIVQVVLGREQVEKALMLPLGENVSHVLHETPSLHDGRWLFIKVTTETDAADVEQLILLKRKPTKQAAKNKVSVERKVPLD
jgi:hypothetical protein